jgi:hypothetical protein
MEITNNGYIVYIVRVFRDLGTPQKCVKHALQSCKWLGIDDIYLPCPYCIQDGRIGQSPIPYLQGHHLVTGMGGQCRYCISDDGTGEEEHPVPFDESNKLMIKMMDIIISRCPNKSVRTIPLLPTDELDN